MTMWPITARSRTSRTQIIKIKISKINDKMIMNIIIKSPNRISLSYRLP